MNIQTLKAENINDEAQLLAQDFVKNFPSTFNNREEHWRDIIAALLRVHGKKVEDEIKETLKGYKIILK